MLYLDSENWLKGSVEYENEEYQRLGSVVTNHGCSDWATTDIPASVKSMWYRLSRRKSDYCIECSQDGVNFKQMRMRNVTVEWYLVSIAYNILKLHHKIQTGRLGTHLIVPKAA